MKRFISVIPFAYLLFAFEIRSINRYAQMILVAVAVLIYLACNSKYWTKRDRFFQIIQGITIFVLFMIISVICVFMHGTGDTSYLLKIVIYIYNFLLWLAFVVHVLKITDKNNYSAKEVFAAEYCRIMMLYIIFTLFCVIVPSFREWWISFVHFSDNEMVLSQQSRYFARIGWDGFAGFGATFRCSLGIVFCLDLLNSKISLTYTSKKQLYFYLAFLLLGNILYGRIGVIASCGMIALMSVIQIVRHGRVGLLLMIVFGIGLFAVSVNILKDSSEAIGTIYRWSFEPILNYLSGKGFTSGSSDTLFNMYTIGKPSLESFWLGDGYYTDPSGFYYKYVDPGILRFIFFWGIIPTVMAYVILIKKIRNSVFSDALTFTMLLTVLALFEFKGEICMTALYIFSAISILNNTKRTDARKRKYVLKLT